MLSGGLVLLSRLPNNFFFAQQLHFLLFPAASLMFPTAAHLLPA